jgi:ribonuclease R
MSKKHSSDDPYATREAQKYSRPIKSREFILQYLETRNELMNLDRLARELGIADEADLEALRRRLSAMERDGQLVRNRRGAYGVPNKMNVVLGRIVGHPDGFGFLSPDDGSDDIFLSAKEMRSLFHGDRALVRIIGVDRRRRREGALVEVIERNTREVVGRFFVEGGLGFVLASNKRISHDIIIPPQTRGEAREGQIVVAEITEQPSPHSQPVGRIVEILGEHLSPGMEIEIAMRSHELPHVWPEAVESEVAGFATEVDASRYSQREDLRSLPLVTIDGEDARDFDDAVYCERHGRAWRLVVAIADVSHYVEAGSALDSEGRLRGNSVYFPGHVIPMLPEMLSNHLCSIRPEVDRLCLACEMVITAGGTIRSARFFEAVMRSHARLTYNQVAAMLLEDDAALRERHADLLPHLEMLHRLYRVLQRAREKRGAIEFDRAETRIVFGAERKIERIVALQRNDAHRMIEEFMIAANIAAADYLLANDIPIVFRTHPEPDAEKLMDLKTFLRELGLRLGGGSHPQAADYAKFLESVADRPDRHLIETVLLRSLAQARYSPENIGHFGLALDAYTHFTSPIRRYPDLLVHRAIKHVLSGRDNTEFRYGQADMAAHAEHCSMTERRADEATREAVDWLKCEYMMSRLGMEFDGLITAVTSFGLFVELDEIYIEGLIHVSALDNDYYHFEPVRHMMYGERSGRTFRLADRIRVKVVRVDLDERVIDFVLAGNGERSTEGKGGRVRRGTGKRARKGAKPGSAPAPRPVAKKAKGGSRGSRGRRRR